MNDEVKDLLNGALSPPPPSALDSGSAIDSGRRALGRRRTAVTGGALAGVVAVAVSITLAMNTIGGDGGLPPGSAAGASPSGTASGQPPELTPDELFRAQFDPDGDGRMEVDMPVVDLPQLPGNEFGYAWSPGFDGVDTPEAAAYGDAFWTYLGQTYPGFRDRTAEGLEDQIGEVPPGVRSVVRDHTAQLVAGVSDTESRPLPYLLPVYTLEFRQNGFESATMIEMPGAESLDGLGMRIYPVGGFTDGTDGVFDLANCEDYETGANGGRTLTYELDCGEAEGPDGELVRTIREDVTSTGGGWSVELTSILYREDGTAVVVTDRVENWEGAAKYDPVLDHADLVALAAAMPDTVVK